MDIRKINPEVKAAWVTALRSGEYKQGQGKLRIENHYCCLSVLCDLHRIVTEEGQWMFDGHYYYTPDSAKNGNAYSLTSAVKLWIGIGINDTLRVPHKGPTGHELPIHLSDLNDEYDLSFSQLADIIEKHL
jgi:hypothetical protein